MFQTLWSKLKEMIQSMLGMNKTIEQALNISPAISNVMVDAIDDWTLMYENKAPWLREGLVDGVKVRSLGLPSLIASEKARMATLEFKSEITAPKISEEVENPNYIEPALNPQTGQIEYSTEDKTIIEEKVDGPVERAEYLNKEYHEKLLSKLRTQLEYGIAKGSLIIKPYVVKKQLGDVPGIEQTGEDKYDIEFDFIQADCFYPFSFDSSGNLKEVAFVQTKTDKDITYTRLEYHKLEGTSVTIINKAFKCMNTNQNNLKPGETMLGTEITLTSVWEWKDIAPTATVKNIDKLLFGYFKMPEANIIDPHSPLGISGFARAKTLIEEADLQYSRLLWEFEGGELAIDIDRDALREVNNPDGTTSTKMTRLQNRLFRQIDLGESDTYRPYNPTLRDNSLLNGLNSILMRIEDVCAISRGTLSEAAAEAKTATELKILKQRSYSSNLDIQKSLQKTLEDVIYSMNVYCTLYNIVGDVVRINDNNIDSTKLGKYEVSFEWDDSILVDADVELNKRITLMEKGIASKVETRMWYYGETEKQAKEALNKVTQETLKAIQQNAIASSQLGQSIQANKESNLENNKSKNNDVQNMQKEQLAQE